MRHRKKACKPHQTLASPRKPSTHRAVIQKRRCKPYQASTRILVSRWSAAVGREFSMKVPKTACSLPHRRQLASTSPSTCFAEPAPRGVSSTGGSSMRSGSREPPLLPSRAPGGPRKGRTRDGCRGLPDEARGLRRNGARRALDLLASLVSIVPVLSLAIRTAEFVFYHLLLSLVDHVSGLPRDMMVPEA